MTDNPKRILLVEDDQLLRELYNELLTSEGFVVDQAEDGDVGFAKIHEGGYQLVLLDIMLPKRDGMDILQSLKDQPAKNANGPIVMLTNLGQEDLIRQGFSYGAAGYLIKSSLTPDQVLQEVHNFLNKKAPSP